ncbi:MAG: 4Fe-4S ferredoxin [Candidatus Bathyarchaeia archaeon]
MGGNEDRIMEVAGRLLRDGEVDLIIGYERGTVPLRSTPCFAKDPEDIDKLIWDPTCDINLAKYLQGREERIGILAKGCDARSIAVCASEGQVEMGKIVILGLPCQGVINRKKIEAEMAGKEILDAIITDENITVKGEGFEEELPTKEFLDDSCLSCRHRNPPVYDVLIGEPLPEVAQANEYAEVDELESRSAGERWAHFVEEIGDCIRCYSCRNVCPMCYCKECFVDETIPAWFGKTNDITDTLIYHLVRAIHLTGRCVDCGACSRACPMDINLRALTKKAEKIARERFDFEAGLDPEETPVLGAFKQEDSEEFII